MVKKIYKKFTRVIHFFSFLDLLKTKFKLNKIEEVLWFI